MAPSPKIVGRITVYRLSSPDIEADPGINAPSVLTAAPFGSGYVSTSAVFDTMHCVVLLRPVDISHLILAGHTVVSSAEAIRTRDQAPIRISGITPVIKQTVMGQLHPSFGHTSIHGEPSAKHVLIAKEHGNRVPIFRVFLSNASSFNAHPIYFRAWDYSKNSFRHGHSNVVNFQRNIARGRLVVIAPSISRLHITPLDGTRSHASRPRPVRAHHHARKTVPRQGRFRWGHANAIGVACPNART
jgi:hypothetical protein